MYRGPFSRIYGITGGIIDLGVALRNVSGICPVQYPSETNFVFIKLKTLFVKFVLIVTSRTSMHFCGPFVPFCSNACLREMKNHHYLWGRHRFELDSSHSQRVFERLLDSEQAAALVKVHPKTLQRYARNGIVSGVRVGKLWRFRASERFPHPIEDDEDVLDDEAQAQ